MQALLTIIGRELMARPRHRLFYVRRVLLLAAVVAVITLILAMAWRGINRSTLGLLIAKSAGHMLIVLLAIAAPYLAASDMITEKEQRTLPVLWLTDMSSSGILIGRLVADLLLAYSIVLLILPLLMLGMSFGGISTSQVLQLTALLGALTFFGTSLGLCCGTIGQNDRQMRILLSITLLLLYLFLPFLLTMHMYSGATSPIRSWGVMQIVSSFAAAELIFSGVPGSSVWWNPLFNVVFGSVLLGVTRFLLPWMVRNYESPSLLLRLRQRLQKRKLLRADRKAPPIAGNPLFWQVFHKESGGIVRTWRRAVIFCCLIACLPLLTTMITDGYFSGSRSLEDFFELLVSDGFFVESATYAVAVFGLALFPGYLFSGGSRMFSQEKKSRTLDLLVNSDLKLREIIFGKYGALLLAGLPYLVLGLIGLASVVLLKDAVDDFFAEEVVYVVAYYVTATYAGMSLGGWSSLCFERNFGMAIIVGSWLLFTTFVSLIGQIYAVSGDSMTLISCGAFFVVGTTFLRQTFQRLGEKKQAD